MHHEHDQQLSLMKCIMQACLEGDQLQLNLRALSGTPCCQWALKQNAKWMWPAVNCACISSWPTTSG